MPISFTPISDGKHWTGYDWSIDNDRELAKFVARIALGHSACSEELNETDLVVPPPRLEARQSLTVRKARTLSAR